MERWLGRSVSCRRLEPSPRALESIPPMPLTDPPSTSQRHWFEVALPWIILGGIPGGAVLMMIGLAWLPAMVIGLCYMALSALALGVVTAIALSRGP